MKISLITPVFNDVEFIEETIKSIIYQKGDFELEYIIIDDGSTDETLKIVKKYDKLIHSKKFKSNCKKLSFKWVSKENTGQSNSINTGFKMVKGDIVNWICSDDLLVDGSLEYISDFFKKNPLENVIFGNALKINEFGEEIGIFKGKNFSREELVRRWDKVYHKFYIVQPSVFYKRKLLKKYGLVRKDLHLTMDYELWLRFKEKFNYVNKIFSKARFTKNDKSVKSRKEQFKESIDVSKNYWGKNYLFYARSYYFYKFIKYPLWKLFN